MNGNTRAGIENLVECIEDGLDNYGFLVIDDAEFDNTTVRDMYGNVYKITVTAL